MVLQEIQLTLHLDIKVELVALDEKKKQELLLVLLNWFCHRHRLNLEVMFRRNKQQ
mgnify:CR=1 FL=1